MTAKKIISLFLVLVMLGSLVTPVMAWGGATHYGIVKNLDDRSGLPSYIYTYNLDYINGAIVPDVFFCANVQVGNWSLYKGCPENWRDLSLFVIVHDGNYFWNLYETAKLKSSNDQQRAYLAGWVSHAISDYYIHGGKPSFLNPPYPKGKFYLEYKRIDPYNLNAHITAEYMVDCLAYYEKGGSAPWPWEFKVYPSFIKSVFQEYRSRYGGNFPIPSESEIVSEFDKLAASIVAEQATFNLGTYAYAKRTFGDYIDWWQAAINASYAYIVGFCPIKTSIQTLETNEKLVEKYHREHLGISLKKAVGEELIEEGFLTLQRHYDASGAYILRLESNLSYEELGKVFIKKLNEKLEKVNRMK
ncbi:MAG: zinc dependent phospholipase C family protein [Archaeoglobaceae archaeon]